MVFLKEFFEKVDKFLLDACIFGSKCSKGVPKKGLGSLSPGTQYPKSGKTRRSLQSAVDPCQW